MNKILRGYSHFKETVWPGKKGGHRFLNTSLLEIFHRIPPYFVNLSALHLRSRLADIASTREGVKSSIGTARTEVEERFNHIKHEIAHTLECRREAILTTISEIERKDLDPLTNLEEKISGELNKTLQLIERGN